MFFNLSKAPWCRPFRDLPVQIHLKHVVVPVLVGAQAIVFLVPLPALHWIEQAALYIETLLTRDIHHDHAAIMAINLPSGYGKDETP